MNQKQTYSPIPKEPQEGLTAWTGAELGILRLSERIRS